MMSTGRVNDPASTTSPASRNSPWAASRSASQATPLAGWLRTPAAMPVSSIWPLRNNSAPIQRRSKSSGRMGRPPTTSAAFAALSEIVSITLRGALVSGSTRCIRVPRISSVAVADMKHQHFADDEPAAGLAEFEALPEATFHRNGRGRETWHLDAFARQRREPQLLDFTDVGRMLRRALVHRRHQGRVRDVNDILLVVEDVLRGILVDPGLAADADRQHRRLRRDEHEGAERREVDDPAA